MAQKRRKRQGGLKRVFLVRRIVLAVICIAVIGLVVWLLWPDGEKPPEEEGAAVPEQSTSQAESSQPQPASQSQSQPEQQSESQQQSQSGEEQPGDWNLLLANNDNPLPEGYAPPQIETVEGYRIDSRIVPNIVRMFTKAREDGISLMICSGYRPYEKQQELFQNQVQAYLNQGYDAQQADEMTVSMIARPGTSEHQTGLALDIVTPDYQTLDEGFAETAAAKWLAQNAHEYGFVLRYPKDKQEITQIIYEPWHFRYVGEEHAQKMKESDQCLEEYLGKANAPGTEQPEAGTEEPSSEDETDQ